MARQREKSEAYSVNLLNFFLKAVARNFKGLSELISWGWYGNDPYVPLDNQDDFSEKLGSEIIIEHNKGHFSGPTDKIFKLPIVLEKVPGVME